MPTDQRGQSRQVAIAARYAVPGAAPPRRQLVATPAPLSVALLKVSKEIAAITALLIMPGPMLEVLEGADSSPPFFTHVLKAPLREALVLLESDWIAKPHLPRQFHTCSQCRRSCALCVWRNGHRERLRRRWNLVLSDLPFLRAGRVKP